MKFVSDSITLSSLSDDCTTHTLRLPFYHRAAVGVFPGTRIFAVPRHSTNEIILTPIDPAMWGDLWRLEAAVTDEPGSAKSLVETLVANNVNVLVHEGVSESIDDGQTVHQIYEILDLAKYADSIDGTSEENRNSVTRPLLRPNRLIAQLIHHATDSLVQTRAEDDWQLKFDRMEFFFRNKEHREDYVPLNLNVKKQVHVPASILRKMPFVRRADEPVALHIISDTEQKYVKLRVLSPQHYYLLLEIQHKERVGAIDEFMFVLRERGANMIDSYSRLKSVSDTALFYALAEFSSGASAEDVVRIAKELIESRTGVVQKVELKGAFGAGPDLSTLELPTGVVFQPGEAESTEAGATAANGDSTGASPSGEPASAAPDEEAVSTPPAPNLGLPYYADRRDSDTWTLNSAAVFMAIPYGGAYEDFYTDVIESAVRESGLDPVRVDRMPEDAKNRLVIEQIEEGIARARFVIADLTGWNPNVLYEVGLAAGISKRLLMLCQDGDFDEGGIPFDFSPYRLVKYNPYKAQDLKQRLLTKLEQLKSATASTNGRTSDE